MISQAEADALLANVASELKAMSYAELRRLDDTLPRSLDNQWREYRQLVIGDERFYVSMLISRLDYFRRRISVELLLSREGDEQWGRVPCVYFERFKSGRLWVARTNRWEEAIFRGLPYVFIAGVVLGLGFLTLRLILH